MNKAHITPGYNGWTENSPKIIAAIAINEKEKLAEMNREENARKREIAELQYYEDNNCFPQPTGYFGTETDAHFYER